MIRDMSDEVSRREAGVSTPGTASSPPGDPNYLTPTGTPTAAPDQAEGRAETTATADAIKVLLVCTANICRSAYAEVAARHMLGANPDVVFASAGTRGLTGQPLNPEMAELLPEGVAYDDFAAKQVTRALVEGADVVLTAEAAHRTLLLEEYPRAFRKVLTLGQFAEAAQYSELRGRALITAVGRQQPPARLGHDVRDPFRRGREANARAAARLDALLDIIVPALLERP